MAYSRKIPCNGPRFINWDYKLAQHRLFGTLAGLAMVSSVSLLPLHLSFLLWEEVGTSVPQRSRPRIVLASIQPIRGTRVRFVKQKRRQSYCLSGLLWAEAEADAGMRFVAASEQTLPNHPLGAAGSSCTALALPELINLAAASLTFASPETRKPPVAETSNDTRN